ncbi:hypothetical protein ACK85X_005039, partial [Salmonella enterica]
MQSTSGSNLRRSNNMAKKTELKPVAARDLQIIEYRGHRVVTTEQ